MRLVACRLTIVVLILTGILGCTKNIDHINDYVYCPENYSFQAPFSKTWDSTIEALLELTAIDTMEQKSGYISTAIVTVDGREMDFIEHAILGQTYKFTYDIRVRSISKQRTQISTKVKLYLEQFMGISRREDSVAQVEHYLREKLYSAICGKLFPGGHGHCSNGFGDQPPEYQRSDYYKENQQSPQPLQPSLQFDTKVKEAQAALSDAGYDPGPADGLMGKKTMRSLEEFQRNNNLSVTGRLDEKTYESLFLFVRPEQQSSPETEPIMIPEHLNPGQQEPNIPIDKPLPQMPSVQPSLNSKERITTTFSTDLLQEEDLFGAEIITVIPADTSLNVISHRGDYYKVRYNGKDGYIHHEFVNKK